MFIANSAQLASLAIYHLMQIDPTRPHGIIVKQAELFDQSECPIPKFTSGHYTNLAYSVECFQEIRR